MTNVIVIRKVFVNIGDALKHHVNFVLGWLSHFSSFPFGDFRFDFFIFDSDYVFLLFIDLFIIVLFISFDSVMLVIFPLGVMPLSFLVDTMLLCGELKTCLLLLCRSPQRYRPVSDSLRFPFKVFFPSSSDPGIGSPVKFQSGIDETHPERMIQLSPINIQVCPLIGRRRLHGMLELTHLRSAYGHSQAR